MKAFSHWLLPFLPWLLAADTANPVPTAFRFEADAPGALRLLWNSSFSAKAERVACLASDLESDTVRISRVQPLDIGPADSLGISAAASLETCGPPQWRGTVHTHVALREGGRPYSLFSGADRGVMMMWWQRWKTDGTFCLLYAEDQAHCEIDGAGLIILPSTRY